MRWNRRRREEDLERELRAHLELEAEERLADRATPEQAHAAARRALGNMTQIRENTRESWGSLWLDRLAQDLRYAARSLVQNPGFAAVVILTTAIGIGANTSIFSIVDAVLLRPLPYRDADRLVSVTSVGKETLLGLRVADFQYGAWRDQATPFDGIAAYTGAEFTITGDREPERLKAQAATPGYLAMLGVSPLIGRLLTDADAGPGRRPGQTALLTHAFWTRRFGNDPAILSRQMTLDGKPYAIAGVLPPGFELPVSGEISLLLAIHEPAAQPGNGTYFYSVIARLKRGVSLERVEADLALIDRRLESAYPRQFTGSRAGAHARVVALRDSLVGDAKPALMALSGAVGLVLLIVCVNVSNLLLARAVARRKEIAVRLALGAGRGRVVRQLLTEGLMLAGLGALGGLGIAAAGVRLLRTIAPEGVPHVQDAGIGGPVLLFNLALATLSGIFFGLAPLRGASTVNPDAALKQSSRLSSGPGPRRLENLLIVCETAFALILLAGAGLLLRTFVTLTAIPSGFQPANVVTAKISLPYWKYASADRQSAFRDALLERARHAPGVEAAGAVACLPYGGFMMMSSLEIAGRPATESRNPADNVGVNYAAGGYFRSLGIAIREGRAIDDGDVPGRPPVAVVNDTLARRYFPGGNALGARIRAAGVTGWVEVVGVSGSVKQLGLASEPVPEIWMPAAQADGGAQTYVIRSSADSRVVVPWLRAQIAELDRDLPPADVQTMQGRMSSLMASQVFVLRLLSLFAAVAIVLAAVGVYSVLAYSVERRSREIGIRMALGARPRQIVGLVVWRALRVAATGAIAGVAGGLALTRYLKSLLHGVRPHDPATLGIACGVILLVAVGAALVPARRASRHDVTASVRLE